MGTAVVGCLSGIYPIWRMYKAKENKGLDGQCGGETAVDAEDPISATKSVAILAVLLAVAAVAVIGLRFSQSFLSLAIE